MLSALSSVAWLKWFGRKLLVLVGQFAMAISLGLFVLFTVLDNTVLIKIMVFIYTFFFEIGIGPILVLYLAEILPEKAMSVAMFMNWALVICITFLTPILMEWSAEGTFAIFAGCCLVGGVFVMFFMKETKGKTKEEVARLYSGVNSKYDQLEKEELLGDEELTD